MVQLNFFISVVAISSFLLTFILRASLVAQMAKSAAIQETRVRLLDQEDFQEKGMATHSSILAWRIPGTEESSRPQSMRSQRLGHD